MFKNTSFTRRFGHFHPVSVNFWINLLFPAILVTFTRHVTSCGSHDVIIGSYNSSSPFMFVLSTLYQKRISETSGRRHSPSAGPFWSLSAVTRPKLNLEIIFMNGQSRIRLSSTDDLLSIVTAAEILIRWHVTWHIQPRHVTIYRRKKCNGDWYQKDLSKMYF